MGTVKPGMSLDQTSLMKLSFVFISFQLVHKTRRSVEDGEDKDGYSTVSDMIFVKERDVVNEDALNAHSFV